MAEERTDVVKRVVASLAADEDQQTSLDRYLERDADILVSAIAETLEATRDEVTEADIERRLEQTILEELRWRPRLSGWRRGLAVLWISRRALIGTLALLAAVSTLVAFFL